MKLGIKRPLITCLAGLVACLVVPGMLKAANININDTGTSGNITITANYFDAGGFYVNGGLVESGTGTNSTTVSESSGSFNFSGTWNVSGTAFGTGSHTVYFTEGNTNNYDDILQYTVTNNNDGTFSIGGNFQSSDTSLGTVPTLGAGESTWNELNGAYTFSALNLTAQVKSPEPATAELLSIGLLGLLGISLVPRRKRCPSA